jgi:hypothetical protein
MPTGSSSGGHPCVTNADFIPLGFKERLLSPLQGTLLGPEVVTPARVWSPPSCLHTPTRQEAWQRAMQEQEWSKQVAQVSRLPSRTTSACSAGTTQMNVWRAEGLRGPVDHGSQMQEEL